MVGLLLAIQMMGNGGPGRSGPGPCPAADRLACSDGVLARRAEPARFEPALPPLQPAAIPFAVTPATLPAASRVSTRWAPTPTDRDQLFEYSDGYYARLSLHRLASYGTLPLFVAQYFAGEELLRNVDHAAGWARAIHGPAAAGVAGLFLVNTVTGGMNMIEGIRDPADRGRRTIHSLLMLIADAGFVWTGVTASGAGRYKPDSDVLRTTHRKVALGSMGVATLGYLIMIPPFRK